MKIAPSQNMMPRNFVSKSAVNYPSKTLVPQEKINLPAHTAPLVVGAECVDSQRAATSD